MSEALLHYLWQFQYFEKNELQTTTGEPVQIFNPGLRNADAGPDFHSARMKIGEMEWIGSAEIHIQSSGWLAHRHDKDPAYDNVVLHIVWDNDKPIRRRDGSMLPTIELRDRVDKKFVSNYQRLLNSPETIPCAPYLPQVPEIIRISAVERAVIDRLESKAAKITETLVRNHGDWQETFYQILSRSFGFKVNADPFEQLARLLPLKVLRKHGDKLLQVEALLFGQAGFLDEEADDPYYTILRREYNILRQKYGLSDRRLNRSQWKFLRLRPANFPTIRLAELAALLFHRPALFSQCLEARSYDELFTLLAVENSEYWKSHYTFFRETREPVSFMGSSSISTVIINTVVPLLVAYGKSKDDQQFVDRAVTILQQTPPETNRITLEWKTMGMKSKTAFDSQGIIELNNGYCTRRRCLDCEVGVTLINPRKR